VLTHTSVLICTKLSKITKVAFYVVVYSHFEKTVFVFSCFRHFSIIGYKSLAFTIFLLRDTPLEGSQFKNRSACRQGQCQLVKNNPLLQCFQLQLFFSPRGLQPCANSIRLIVSKRNLAKVEFNLVL